MRQVHVESPQLPGGMGAGCAHLAWEEEALW